MSTDQPVGVSPRDLARLPEFYHPVVSPDGDEVAFYYDETGRNELYVLDRESGAVERWSDGEVPRDARWHLLWGADGGQVYFHRDDAGDEQNDLLALDREGTVESLVAVDGQAILTDASEDGRYLLYASDEGEQLNAYRYDLETGERVQLTAFDQPVTGGLFSPDAGQIAFVGNESATLENDDVYVAAADGSDRRRLDVGMDGSATAVADWFPDGERLLVSDDDGDLRQVGVYDLTTDEVAWFGPHEAEESAIAVSPEGERLLATRARRGATVPVVYDVETGEGRELAVPEGVAHFGQVGVDEAFADESTVVFAHSRPDQRKELYEYDLATDEYEVLLAATYDDVDPDAFVDAEYVTYESTDGQEIGAILYDPRGGPAREAGETAVPGVVLVHGGPHGRTSKSFHLAAQVLATRGYAVLAPNYRGSVGRGREFKQAILGDWGGAEQADVAEGGRWLMARKWVDADRVAVFGGSYGGYSVYCQLTQYPDLWATGVAWVGITDLHALYEEDMPHFQHALREHMGDPQENRDLWRERSPIEHVDAMERPIFVVHGVNDPRCPISQARLFRDALEARGWDEGEDFEYEELGAEGHGSTDVENKIRTFELLSDYLERRLEP